MELMSRTITYETFTNLPMTLYAYQNFLRMASNTLTDANIAAHNSALIVVNFEGLPELDGVLGYIEVDEILFRLTNVVRDALNTTDLVGPSGRYQICCLLSNLLTSNHAVLAAHKILRLFTLQPYLSNDRRITLLPRIGVALNNSKNSNLKQLMCNASSALHQAKRNREPIQLFNDEERDLLLSGIDIWSELDQAISAGELQLVYQPQYWIASGSIHSAEALLRWNHPTRGAIPPDKLISIAEGTELMRKLTIWIFNTAFRQCAEYRRAGADTGVSINLSADDLCDPELVDLIRQAVNIWGINPANVMIELTETAIMENQHGSLETLLELKDIGFRLAMDDFGTGYSSLERLLQLPLDEIKIDMMFIKNMLTQHSFERIVSSMINMGHQLGLHVIAEGVEDSATYNRLQTLGCDAIQGYYIGKGMSLPELINKIAATNREISTDRILPNSNQNSVSSI